MINGTSPAWYFYIGLIAAICIGIYMMPQMIKTIKTKDTVGVSIIMLVLAVVGDSFFVIQGIAILATTHDVSSGLPILLGNLFGLAATAVTAFFKFRNMHRAKSMNLTEKDFCANYETNVEIYKTKFAKKKEEDKPVEAAQ